MQPWDCRHCDRSAECMRSVLTRGVDEGIIGDYVGGELAHSRCESRAMSYESMEARMDEVQAIIERHPKPVTAHAIHGLYTEVGETILQVVLAKLREEHRVHARQFYGSTRWLYHHKPIGDEYAPRTKDEAVSKVAECKSAGMSIAQTAAHLGLHVTTVSRYRNMAKHQGL